MITGLHTIIYAEQAEAARAFFRDVFGLPHIDSGHGWLIFKMPPAELGVHPTDDGVLGNGRHELYLTCDDIHATVADLSAKGVEFASDIVDADFGPIPDPAALAARLAAHAGIVEHGLFVGLTDTLVVGGADGITIQRFGAREVS